MNILYVGSGRSAQLVKRIDLSKYKVACVNNAWRLFEKFDIWIHSGDFPSENRPKTKNFEIEVSHREYNKAAQEMAEKLGAATRSPSHYFGYTAFFNGLYWLMNEQPKKISLLGFDHDYNPEKVKKWQENNKPSPQNQYLKPKDMTINEWLGDFFKGMEKDSFYGQGTPDPLRLGEKHLKDKFLLAIENAKKLNIELVNLSPVESNINMVQKEKIQ